MFLMNALYLLAAGTVVGPILYHFLLRDRPKRQVLPTLRFLTASAPQSYAMHKLKNLLLLILRTAIILLIVFAFARPFLDRSQDAELADRADTGTVFAIDTSLSMSADGRWEAALARVRTLSKVLPRESPLALVTFDSTVQLAVGPTTDRASVLAELKRLSPTAMPTDITNGLRVAADVASTLEANRKVVYFISDFQESVFHQESLDWRLPEGVEVLTVPIAESGPLNAAITSVNDKQPAEHEILVQVDTFGEGQLEATLSVHHDGSRVASAPVQLSGGKRETFTLSIDKLLETETQLEIRLDAKDALEEDNTFAYVREAASSIPLLVLERTGTVVLGSTETSDAPPGANPYLASALTVLGDGVTPNWLDPGKATKRSLSKYRVVLLSVGEAYSATLMQDIDDYVTNGGSIILFPEAGQTEGLAELSGAEVNGWGRVNRAESEFRLVTSVDANGPFGTLDRSGQSLLGHPKAFRYLKTNAGPDVNTLARFDDGSPFLLERRYGEGLVYLFTVPLDSSATDFVLRAAFAPFLNELITYAADETKTKRLFAVGNRLPVNAEFASVIRPAAVASGEAARHFREPGFHTVRRDGNEWKVAAHIDPLESNLKPAELSRIESWAAQSAPIAAGVVPLDPNLASIQEQPDSQWRIWSYLLMGALALMAAESILASRTNR